MITIRTAAGCQLEMNFVLAAATKAMKNEVRWWQMVCKEQSGVLSS